MSPILTNPHILKAFPTINILYQSCVFVIIDEPLSPKLRRVFICFCLPNGLVGWLVGWLVKTVKEFPIKL